MFWQSETDHAAKRLQEALNERLRSLADEADPAASLDAEKVGAIERIDRLVQLCRRQAPRRAFMIGLYSAAAAVVAFLLFFRVTPADVAVDVRTSEVSLRLAEADYLTRTLAVAELAVAGIDRVLLPPGLDPLVGGLDLTADDVSALKLTAPQGESIVMNAIHLPGGTSVRLFTAAADGSLRLAVRNDSEPVIVSLTLPVGVNLAAPGMTSSPAPLALDRHRPLEFHARAGGRLDLELIPLQEEAAPFRRELAISALAFERMRENEGVQRRRVSTVLSGDLYLETLGDRKYPLRHGELLRMNLVLGTLAEVTEDADALLVRATARVSALTLGGAGIERNLMPRLLEWIQAQAELLLFLSTATVLLPVTIKVAKWLKTGLIS